MTIVDQLDRIRGWVEANICANVRLKVPDDERTGTQYEHKLVQPAAFVLYMPGKDRLPEEIPPIPCVCVQPMEGSSDVQAHTNTMPVRLVFAAWNPGNHGPDNLPPTAAVEGRIGEGVPVPTASGPVPAEQFTRGADGWRDVWNFVDVAIRELESVNIIDGIQIRRDIPIRFGPVTEQDDLVDFWPYWYAWVTFQVQTGIARNNQQQHEYL